MDAIFSHQWLGESPALMRLKRQMSKFSGVDFPLIIQGEKGSGKALAAYTIHHLSARRENKFVSTCCLSWDIKSAIDTFQKYHRKAQGGTLLLKNINALPEWVLNRIQHVWEREYMGQNIPVRIMCTFSERHNNANLIESSAPWLSLSMPSLQQRKEDIPPLLVMLKEKYKNIQELTFSNECWPILLSQKWEDNVKGLERFYAKIAVLSDIETINKTLLFDYFPELKSVEIEQLYIATNANKRDSPKLGSNNNEVEFGSGLAQLLLENEMPESAQQHIAVTRSLEFMIEQFNEKITIEQAAQNACVSSPHLSFLFRKHLGTSFKKLLLELRIEYSKKLLLNQPSMQITQISHETGFHDLSHFEKTFRKFVGVKPSHFRRNIH